MRAPAELSAAVAHLLSDAPENEPSTNRLVNALTASMLDTPTPNRIADQVLATLDAIPNRNEATTTTKSLANLILAAAQPRPGAAVLDLAAGEGNLLLALARRGGRDLTLTGIDNDPDSSAIARCRTHLAGIHADIRLADTMAGPVDKKLKADIVLVDPPLDQRGTYRRWMAAALAACRPDGLAVVALPALTATAARPEWRDTGRRHASFIIKCPSRLRNDYGDALVLWGLQPEPPHKLLLIDATRLGSRRATTTDIDPIQLRKLHDAIQTWALGDTPTLKPPLAARQTPRHDLDTTSDPFFDHIPDPKAIATQTQEALQIASRLQELLDDNLRPYTAEHHRRAIRTLIQKLQDQQT